jgi:putative nucleotidyltransferase with HDIG domain
MKRIAVISDSDQRAADLKVRLADFFEADFIYLDQLSNREPEAISLIEIDLRNPAQVLRVKCWLENRPVSARAFFSVNRGSHRDAIQAHAIGATDVICRPVDGKLLFRALCGGLRAIAADASITDSESCQGVSECIDALKNMFSSAISGKAPDLQTLNAASAEIVDRIADEGLARWLEIIRKHHSQTYQHCLIVTTVAVSFGRLLGFSNSDKRRLASAALLHDFGKALIPIEILEKPAPLNGEEIALMRTHAELGFEALRDAPDLDPEMLDLVLHHHEYLDGSGYPHGICGNKISDLVRVITIADVYGALIERRPYKAPFPSARAYQLLQDMGAKLDTDLVRVFRPLAQTVG